MLDFAPSDHTPRFAFGKYDRVTIGGIAYRPVDATDAGYVFVRLDGQGVAESYSRSEIARLVELGRVEHKRDALLPENAKARLAAPSDMLAMLPAKQHRRARRKEATVLSFLEMEAGRQVNRTDEAIERETDAIIGRASRMLKGASQYDDYQREAGELAATAFSPRTLRRWLSAYEDLGLSGLYDGISNRGNRERRLCAKSLMIMSSCLRNFMTSQEMTQEAVFKDVKNAFDRENVQRRAEGRPELVRPSKETVRLAIAKLDPYQCDVARHGVEYSEGRAPAANEAR